ncbi:major facilitator superfamily domain-containing protein [Rhexocercosporidium sp. MPI-PUGE-AT-0058]|nr:major facilitator superfamily domain-containing protein [Rhexocercosporidium sp. MPI-PUGE-AT-0058]
MNQPSCVAGLANFPASETNGKHGRTTNDNPYPVGGHLTEDSNHKDSSEDRIEGSTVHSEWTSKEESQLVRKLDMRVLFPCTIVYFLAYLDRANLGAVKILGADTPNSLETSLGLVGKQFNWSVSITYFAVTAGLLPANIIMKKVSAKYFFPSIMILRGIVVMSIAASKNAAGLMAGRFFLGIPEAGVVPASIMFFSMWYKPSERALRISVFHSANVLAAAVSAFIAGGIGSLEGAKGLHATRKINSSQQIRQRRRSKNRCLELGCSNSHILSPIDIHLLHRIFSVCIVGVAQGTFLPTILHVFLKFGPAKANLFTALAALAIIPLYWIWGLHSDWTRERMWHFVIPVLVSVPCYAVWTFVGTHPSARGSSVNTLSLYGMAYLGEMSLLAQPVLLSYRTSTLYGASEQAVGGAAAVASLSIASIIAPQMYPNEDSPNYVPGFTGTLAFLVICIAAYLSLPFQLLREANTRKKKTGYAIPLQALEDTQHSEVSPATRDRTLGDDFKLGADPEIGDVDFRGNDAAAISHVEKV